MVEKEIENKILEAFAAIGIFITADEILEEPIDELIQDSLSYISFIVELEEVFGIEIPDEFLNPERVSTFSSIKSMIKDLLMK